MLFAGNNKNCQSANKTCGSFRVVDADYIRQRQQWTKKQVSWYIWENNLSPEHLEILSIPACQKTSPPFQRPGTTTAAAPSEIAAMSLSQLRGCRAHSSTDFYLCSLNVTIFKCFFQKVSRNRLPGLVSMHMQSKSRCGWNRRKKKIDVAASTYFSALMKCKPTCIIINRIWKYFTACLKHFRRGTEKPQFLTRNSKRGKNHELPKNKPSPTIK